MTNQDETSFIHGRDLCGMKRHKTIKVVLNVQLYHARGLNILIEYRSLLQFSQT